MRKLLATLLVALTAIGVTAQEKSTFTVILKATNALTHQEILSTFYFLNADSTVIDSTRTAGYTYEDYGGTHQHFFTTVATLKSVPGREHLLKVVAEGYEPEYRAFTLPTGKVRQVDLSDVLIYPEATAIELGEVTVKHSRVKMVMKGDTIVFDAAKFQLAHGDMLSEMIKQMEGLSIVDGVIYMNGRKVDDLLVNGESFFKGDPSVALNNLPAFTVRNIKIYEKTPESAYITGEVPGQYKDYVLDVQLKREYVSGYLGNIEGGWGSRGRYVGRGFGLGFGQKFRLAAFFNVNNIQNVQTATSSSSGDWDSRGTGTPIGLADRQLGGIDYQYTANKEVKVSGQANFQHNTQTRQTIQSITNFLDRGNTFTRNIDDIRPREFRFSTNHTLQVSKPKVFFKLIPALDYNHFNTDRLNRNVLYTAEPSETRIGEAVDSVFSRSSQSRWFDGLLYRLSNRQLSRTDGLNLRLNGNAEIKFDENSSDYMTVAAFVKFNRQNDVSRTDYDLTYTDPATAGDAFNRYTRNNPHSWEYEFCTAYDWKTAPNRYDGVWSMRPYVSFNSTMLTKDDRLFNLDPSDFEGMGLTIAQQNALQTAIDRQNSYWSSQHDKTGLARTDFAYQLSGNKFSVNLQGGTKLANSTLNYDKPGFYQHADRTDWLPFASFKTMLRLNGRDYKTYRQVISFDIAYSQSAPDLVYQIDTRNTTDPLNILLSNPDLKRPSTLSLTYQYNGYFINKGPSFYVYGGFRDYHNSVTQARIYNPSTGVTVRQPMNVSGSNNLYGNVMIGQELFAGIRADVRIYADLYRYVDLFSEGGPLTRNVVNQRTLVPSASLSYSPGKIDIYFDYGYEDLKTSSSQQYMASTRYGQHMINGMVRYTLPWKMIINTDVSTVLYRGSTNQSMNRNSVLCNLRVSQPLLKDKWIVTLIAHDLLNKSQNIYNLSSASAATQQWQLAIGRYFMVSLAYRLNYSPRK